MENRSLPLNNVWMDTNTTETAPVTVNRILDRYEREYIPKKLAPRTQVDYRRHLVVLRRWYGERIAGELKPKDFAEFLNGVDRGKFQRVRQLAVLSSAFTQAVSRWYWIDNNVLRNVARERGEPRDRLIKPEEFAGCRALAPLRVKLAMDLALITGQRQGDILNFRWADIAALPEPVVDPVTKETITHEMTVFQSKTRKRIGIGITKELDAVLDRCWLLPNRGEYILTRTMGGRFTCEGFRARWQWVMRKWMRSGGENFHFHDIRALCATRQPTPEHARRLLGHTSIAMTMRVYRRGVERVIPTQIGA